MQMNSPSDYRPINGPRTQPELPDSAIGQSFSPAKITPHSDIRARIAAMLRGGPPVDMSEVSRAFMQGELDDQFGGVL